MTEIIVYGLAKDATERWQEDLLSAKARTQADVAAVMAAASKDGYHSFRVATWDGSAPDFAATLK